MDLIYIGKIVNTHGIKGEVRIISDFKYKDTVFKIGNKLVIDNQELVISSYRQHKNYDMVMFKEINDINDVLKYKGSNVYVDRNTLDIDGILDEDLIGLSVYDLDGNDKGKVIDIYKSKLYDLLVIKHHNQYLVPNIDEFVKEVNLTDKKIIINYIEGLENEN